MESAKTQYPIEDCTESQPGARGEAPVQSTRKPARGYNPMEAGFTLMEMVIVMSIMVILASVGVANYQKIREKAKETLLKDDLKTMRKLIDQYSADKEALPDSLDDLVSGTYMREVPIDPITGNADWQLELGDDPFARTTKQGVIDVHSKAPGADAEGKPFADY